MKVFYKSKFIYKELEPGCVFRTVPDKAVFILEKEKNDLACEIILDGTILDAGTEVTECKPNSELVIKQEKYSISYYIKPLIHPISNTFLLANETFSFEFDDKEGNEIEAIQNGEVRMYAVDQSTDISDWTEIFDLLEASFNTIKAICEKPKSHLKAVNEVRPIETVKRVGYESIPYLAAHSEDWLARTATGLKPERLFSRVEEDDYQIYENRVVKTMIDLIINFLRKSERQYNTQYEQLHGIIDSNVQVASFGFDASFQKAVSELLNSDEKEEANRDKAFQLVERLQEKSKVLLKKYRTLQKSRLYKYLKKTKPVTNPLNETNILMIDKKYKVVFKLWKKIHRAIAPSKVQEPIALDFKYAADDYMKYCKTICGYSAHVLGFDIVNDGNYYRSTDEISFTVEESEGLIHCYLRDDKKRNMEITGDLELPIADGESCGSFYYDGHDLWWKNNVSDNDIESFCTLLKDKGGNGRKKAEYKKKYQMLKMAITDTNRNFPDIKRAHFVIWPAIIEVEKENCNMFKEFSLRHGTQTIANSDIDYFIVALPRCEEGEQRLTNYAKYDNENVMFLPITMFDINSFRRIQNLLIRLIVKLETGKCPCCGNSMRNYGNQKICDNCNQLILTETICPNPECRSTFKYISYDVSEDTIRRMENISEDNFYQMDSIYQYKDIVPMEVSNKKIRAVCPYCGK